MGAWHCLRLPSLTRWVLLLTGEPDNFVSGTVVASRY